MNISLTNQAMVFWISVLGGAVTGVVFDFFRAFRKSVESGIVAVAIQDILFWLISAGVVFSFMYRFNNGEARWYIFCGMVLGAILYHNSISPLVVKLIVKVFYVLRRCAGLLIRVLLFPLVILLKILRGPFFIVMMPLRGAARILRKLTGRFGFSWSQNLRKIKKRFKKY